MSDSMRLTATWRAVPGRETDGDVVFLDRAEGLQPQDLQDLRVDAPGEFSADEGTFGKGASGAGVALVLELAEHVINDAASLIAIGAVLRAAIKRVSHRREQQPAVVDPVALAALAADEFRESLEGAYYYKTVPLNLYEGVGTDERDVYACVFEQADGVVHVIFMSPTGLCLGSVRVPAEMYVGDGGEVITRSAEDIAAWWDGER